jgi:hypothetical protein
MTGRHLGSPPTFFRLGQRASINSPRMQNDGTPLFVFVFRCSYLSFQPLNLFFPLLRPVVGTALSRETTAYCIRLEKRITRRVQPKPQSQKRISFLFLKTDTTSEHR